MDNEAVPPAVRLKAARDVIDRNGKELSAEGGALVNIELTKIEQVMARATTITVFRYRETGERINSDGTPFDPNRQVKFRLVRPSLPGGDDDDTSESGYGNSSLVIDHRPGEVEDWVADNLDQSPVHKLERKARVVPPPSPANDANNTPNGPGRNAVSLDDVMDGNGAKAHLRRAAKSDDTKIRKQRPTTMR